MDYTLTTRVLQARPSNDVRELITLYAWACDDLLHKTRVIESRDSYIKILEAENNLLKKEINNS